jgi:hypothetical protein
MDDMTKVVWAVWDPARRDRAELRRTLLEVCAPTILQLGPGRLWMCIADDRARYPSPTPFPLWGPRCVALVNAWLPELSMSERITAELQRHGLKVAAYRADETIPTDYGDNEHAGPRDWPDGTRSPGISLVTFAERPTRLDRDEWIRRWHGRMTPVSARIQPRTRYVRNLVEEPLTEGALPFEGIIEEAWPSPQHVRNPFLFYGARNPWQLARNVWAILAAVTHFLTLWRIQAVMMSEYFIKS